MKNVRLGMPKDRVDTVIDGVFAIVLTLLVLELKVPEGLSLQQLPGHLLELAPKFEVYAAAFTCVAIGWMSHYFFASVIIRTDFTHVALNMLQLLFISLVPFTAALLGSYIDSPVALAFFGLSAAAYALVGTLNWWHCTRGHHLTHHALSDTLVRDLTVALCAYTGGWFLTVALGFVSPRVGLGSAIVVLIVSFMLMLVMQPRIAAAQAEAESAPDFEAEQDALQVA
ncbi:TMEM175 family protein [Deinococcus yavapaiensis]|uniref:Putative membrane protein n=1 Tax=Deinococcus yavapaiensis KR-236 TaxID=694435 RepID=A0A318S8I6_9DEIO|nr:TMEM175 family protein [Deinococcus yavapaiensis]PYE55366.1 putative membrane protein [Deinococcus yavapaiensis KR-236]